jgi:hypothetical protein
MSVVVDMRREDDTNGIMATLRDSAGKSIDESETSAGKILKEAVTSKGAEGKCVRAPVLQEPTLRSTDEIDRMGDRLAAEYIIHTDTWTDTNMEYLLVLRIVVRMQPRVMTSNKTFSKQQRRSLFPVCSWRHRLV